MKQPLRAAIQQDSGKRDMLATLRCLTQALPVHFSPKPENELKL